MRTVLGITLLCIVLFLLVLVFGAEITHPKVSGSEGFEFALQWSIRALGGIVAVVSAVGMVLIAAAHGPFERQFGLVLPLLGGLMLWQLHWSLGVAIAAVVVAWLVGERFSQPRPPQ